MTAQSTDQYITPTGVLVYDGEPGTDEWLDVRRGGITATDLPKILGLSQYGGALHVWLDKLGRLHDEAGEAAYWGTVMEPHIAERWTEKTGASVRRVGVLAHAEKTWLRASLDYLVNVCPDGEGPCGLECKARSAYKAGDWAEDVPDDVYAQVQVQMLVTGYRHIHTAVLFDGNRMRMYRVDADREDQAHIEAEGRRVWDAVLSGEPPADHPGPLMSAALNRIYPNREGALDATGQKAKLDALITEYNAAHADETSAKQRKEVARALLAQFLGSHEAAVIEGVSRPVVTLKREPVAEGRPRPAHVRHVLRVSDAYTPGALQ